MRRNAVIASEQLSATSRRTALPKCRCGSSPCSAMRRFFTSSSSTNRSLLRVTRNWYEPSTCMPANSSRMFACSTADRNTNPLGQPATCGGSRTTLGSTRGACTMAAPDLRPNASLPSSSTAKLSDLFSTRGNGCAGSRPIGVSTGITSRKKYARTHSCWAGVQSLRRRKQMPSAASLGSSSSLSSRYWRSTSSCARCATSGNSWRGEMPSGCAPAAPRVICSFRPPTRISKNSSRLLDTMHRKRNRSSSGFFRFSASSSTRMLNASRPSSRFRKWSGGGRRFFFTAAVLKWRAHPVRENTKVMSHAFQADDTLPAQALSPAARSPAPRRHRRRRSALPSAWRGTCAPSGRPGSGGSR